VKQNIFILGINGYLGRVFQKFIEVNLLYQQFNFIGIGRSISNQFSSNVQFVEQDLTVTDWSFLKRTETCDYIINLVGRSDTQIFLELLKTNLFISESLLNYIQEQSLSVKKILLIGSAAEYGKNSLLPLDEKSELMPINPYGLSKVYQTYLAQYYFNVFSLPVIIARTFNIIGDDMPRHLSVGAFKHQIQNAKQGDEIQVGNLDAKRDYLHVNDVIKAYWDILIKGQPGEIYNVSSGVSITIKDILDAMINQSGKKLKILQKNSYLKKQDIPNSLGNNEKLKMLDWRPLTDLMH